MKKKEAEQSLKSVLNYHERSKHHFHKFAKSLGYMDWESRPDPFRSYPGCASLNPPLLSEDPTASSGDLFFRENNRARPFSLENISGAIELSMGLSAWKQIYSSRWSLRMNPSSGNLHPTESYWILPGEESRKSEVYHYNPRRHRLESRAELPESAIESLREHFDSDGFLFALSAIFWRESWKYGERAFRYCNHDAGHALAAISFAANLMGWKVNYLHGIDDSGLRRILGFDQTEWIDGEAEEANLLCWVCPNDRSPNLKPFSPELINELSRVEFHGKPEPLSPSRHSWTIIEKTALACRKLEPGRTAASFSDFVLRELPKSSLSAAQIIRRRRSATDFNRAKSRISWENFAGCLRACLPGNNRAPFDAGLMEPANHLFIFVHNVDGLDPGLYAMVRNPGHFDHLKTNSASRFQWKKVCDSPPLYLLETGDAREKAIKLSCDQAIAGDGAFSLSMAARFADLIKDKPRLYKRLFWEAGMIGQVLYLQAEAYGLRGTGIGCFFDDAVHEFFGFKDNSYQALYHFTVGFPEEDKRLTTLPPYDHLRRG